MKIKTTIHSKFLFTTILLSTIHPASIPGKRPISLIANYSQDSLSVLTWNVYMLPKIASLSKEIGNTHLKVRAQQIADYLYTSNYDIIVLQEVFSKTGYNILKNKLKDKYPFISEPFNNRNVFKTHSGLVLLSKIPIHQFKTIQFSDCSSNDCFSNKGAFQACFTINHRKFSVIGTHLQSDYHYVSEFRDTRNKQLKEMVDEFKLNLEDKSQTNLFCGDFNIANIDTAHYNHLLTILKAKNFDDAVCSYTWHDYNDKQHNNYFYDYCLVNQYHTEDKICQQVVGDINAHFSIKPSDHLPVKLSIQLHSEKMISQRN